LTLTQEEFNNVSSLLPTISPGNYSTSHNDSSVLTSNQTIIMNTESPSISPTIWNQTCDYLEEIRLENQCRNGYRTKQECIDLASNLGLYPVTGLVQTWQETSSSFFTDGCIHFINAAGQRFMKWNTDPIDPNAAGSNVPSDELCYVDPVYTAENNYSYSGCACLCPPETEDFFNVQQSGNCPLGNHFEQRQQCQDIANQLGYDFDQEFTPSLYFPLGCVYDVPNKVMVYNHWNTNTGTKCSDKLVCYCGLVTNAPTSYPTAPTTGVPTGGGIDVVAVTPTPEPTMAYFIPYYENQQATDAVGYFNKTIQFQDFPNYPGASLSTYGNQVVVGTTDGNIYFYKIEGGKIVPDTTTPSITDNGFTNLAVSFVELNADGYTDMFIGTHEGPILTYRWNQNDTRYDRIRGPWEGVLVGRDTVVSCADLDGDGDHDCVVGEENGNINYFENIGDKSVPKFKQRHGEIFADGENFFHHIDVGDNSYPALIDANYDGLIDIIIGSKGGSVVLYLNDGTIYKPDIRLNEMELLIDPMQQNVFVGYLTKPAKAFMNQDDLPDFILTSSVENPDAVIHDSMEYTWVGIVSVFSLFGLAGMIFSCRNFKYTAPLVTAQHSDELQEFKLDIEHNSPVKPIGCTSNTKEAEQPVKLRLSSSLMNRRRR